MKKILFTGFEPFGGECINPSWEAVLMLPEMIEGTAIVRSHLPVEYDRAAVVLRDVIEKERPDAVICVGQAGGRSALTVEMVAINWRDAQAPDNAGVICSGEFICKDGPAAYFATVPVKEIIAGMKDAGVPAGVSYSAGAYVCNNIMYHLLHMLEHDYPGVQGGFIHVPYECSQVLGKNSAPSLPLSVIAAGLEAAARVTIEMLCEI